MPHLIALEGIDGSGKGTQAQRLYDRLVAGGSRAALISFPRYAATTFGRMIGEILDGRHGSLAEIDPFSMALLYAGDRYESRMYLLDAVRDHDVVVLDRYVASNIAHQAAKLPEAQRPALIDKIERLEFELNELPPPDQTILLDLPVLWAQKLIARKNQRSYTDKVADLHEADADYLEQVRRVYLRLAAENSDWHVVSCCRGEELRSVEEIAAEIHSTLETQPTTHN